MTRAQLIQGTGAELRTHLEKHRDRKRVLLIIPEEEAERESATCAKEAIGETPVTTVRNGVPLLPTAGSAQQVTMELVKRLAEED